MEEIKIFSRWSVNLLDANTKNTVRTNFSKNGNALKGYRCGLLNQKKRSRLRYASGCSKQPSPSKAFTLWVTVLFPTLYLDILSDGESEHGSWFPELHLTFTVSLEEGPVSLGRTLTYLTYMPTTNKWICLGAWWLHQMASHAKSCVYRAVTGLATSKKKMERFYWPDDTRATQLCNY